MIRRRKAHIIAAAIGVLWLSAVGAAQPAAAETDDQRFADAVATLKIPTTPGDDLPAVGHRICDMLTSGLAGNINPVPTVRGVVNTLENAGFSRGQAGGLTKAAVAVYCPQHASVIGR
jgi:Protein of unknown function (DUF732)